MQLSPITHQYKKVQIKMGSDNVEYEWPEHLRNLQDKTNDGIKQICATETANV